MLYIGTSGWYYEEWVNEFYPQKLPKAKWLSYYADNFNVVEINATFYRFFKDEVFRNWYEQVPSEFKFILKAPKLITHVQRLEHVDVNEFSASARLLKEKLGLILFQLPPGLSFSIKTLENFLMRLPSDIHFAIEFRHPQWFCDEVKLLLQKYNCTTCNPDSPQINLTTWLTTNTAYLRLHGRTKWFDYEYKQSEIIAINNLTNEITLTGAENIYILFNNTVKAHAIKNAVQLKNC